ncbi:MAG: AAA family ATPase [Deltaproteobacteria bacterium]
MYCDFFGFSVKPFELTPDSNFLYLSHETKEVFATLKYGIIQRRGFTLLLGEPGTGKTTLINSLIDQSRIDAKFACISNPDMNFNELLHTILIEFDIASAEEDLSKTKAIHRLKAFVNDQFEKDSNAVILVDEAQCLEIKTLEKLRLLSNLETRKHKLIQIILSGQPELECTLSQKNLTQLAQRIGLRCRITSLNEKDAYEYIDYRLNIAGYKGPQLFGNKAKYLIWTYSKGIPRAINIICDNSLLTGYSIGQQRINSSIVKEVIDDLNKVSLDSADYPRDKSKGTIKSVSQEPLNKLDEIREVLPESLEKKNDGNSSLINRLRKKLSRNQHSGIVLRRERRFSATWITVIAGVTSVINIFVLFSFAGNFRELKSEFQSKLAAMNNSFQYQSDGAPNSENKTPSDNRSTLHKSISENKNDVEDDRGKNTIVVSKGETLFNIILRAYGENNPKILDAILKINPEIKNPNLITEKQVIKLPDKREFGISSNERVTKSK